MVERHMCNALSFSLLCECQRIASVLAFVPRGHMLELRAHGHVQAGKESMKG